MTEPVEQRSGFDIPEGSATPGDVDWEKAHAHPTTDEEANAGGHPEPGGSAKPKATTKSHTANS